MTSLKTHSPSAHPSGKALLPVPNGGDSFLSEPLRPVPPGPLTFVPSCVLCAVILLSGVHNISPQRLNALNKVALSFYTSF